MGTIRVVLGVRGGNRGRKFCHLSAQHDTPFGPALDVERDRRQSKLNEL